MSNIAPAKIVSKKTYQVAGKLNTTEWTFEVPCDYNKPREGNTRLFARSVRKRDSSVITDTAKDKEQLPWMCFLNGGPGMACRPPQQYPLTNAVLEKGYQMLYLDQRGTGMSTPITASTLQMRGDDNAQAGYLKLFRADSIVKDCEAVRQVLTADYPDEKKKWSITGQSFGGFCAITYLSFFPQGLREAFLFGGLQPLVKSPDEVYRRLYRKVAERNEAYYAKYPDDIKLVKHIMTFLKQQKTVVSDGGACTPRRFRQLGIAFGAHGGLDSVHEIVLRASYDLEAFGELTRGTLSAIEQGTSFDNHLIYSILHEPIYCEGTAAAWSAHRVQAEYDAFDLDNPKTEDQRIYFYGELIFPWMFEDYAELRQVQKVAEIVAADSQWPALFDEDQLAKNEVPVFAAAYLEDMYVDWKLSMATAKKIKGCKVFATNVMFHDAIRSKMDEVVKQAFALRDDVVD